MNETIRKELSRFTVGVAGVGGLGSNCAVALARAGIGKLVLADFDTVSEANLDRQYYFRDHIGMMKVEALADTIARIDPRIRTEVHGIRITEKNISPIFSECDVLVEAFDGAEAKRMLVEYVLDAMPDLPIVAASGIAGYGNMEAVKTTKSGNLVMVGDLETEVSDKTPPLAPKVGAAACMQADAVISVLLDKRMS